MEQGINYSAGRELDLQMDMDVLSFNISRDNT